MRILSHLFERELSLEQAYYLVYPPLHANRAGVAAFRSWVLEVAAAESGMRANPGGL